MEQRIATPKQMAAILAARRRARAHTQTAVANVLTLSQGRYSEIEQDPSKLTLDRLLVLLNHLGLELIVRDTDSRPTSPTDDVEW